MAAEARVLSIFREQDQIALESRKKLFHNLFGLTLNLPSGPKQAAEKRDCGAAGVVPFRNHSMKQILRLLFQRIVIPVGDLS